MKQKKDGGLQGERDDDGNRDAVQRVTLWQKRPGPCPSRQEVNERARNETGEVKGFQHQREWATWWQEGSGPVPWLCIKVHCTWLGARLGRLPVGYHA